MKYLVAKEESHRFMNAQQPGTRGSWYSRRNFA